MEEYAASTPIRHGWPWTRRFRAWPTLCPFVDDQGLVDARTKVLNPGGLEGRLSRCWGKHGRQSRRQL